MLRSIRLINQKIGFSKLTNQKMLRSIRSAKEKPESGHLGLFRGTVEIIDMKTLLLLLCRATIINQALVDREGSSIICLSLHACLNPYHLNQVQISMSMVETPVH